MAKTTTAAGSEQRRFAAGERSTGNRIRVAVDSAAAAFLRPAMCDVAGESVAAGGVTCPSVSSSSVAGR